MTDPKTVRLVAGVLGAVVLITVLGAFALLLTGRSIDAVVVGIGSTALGYLAGLLTPSGTQEVIVKQPPGEPVPVTDGRQ